MNVMTAVAVVLIGYLEAGEATAEGGGAVSRQNRRGQGGGGTVGYSGVV